MDWLAIQAMRWMNLDQLSLILAQVGLMLVGGILAELFLRRGRGPEGQVMRRAGWFVLSGLVVLPVATAQIWWTYAVPALIGGWLGVLFLLDLVVPVLAGSLLVVLARMRARDAWGDGRRAIFAVIPLAHLLLLFTPGRDAERRDVAPFGLRGTAAVLVGIVLLTAVRAMPKLIEPMITRSVTEAMAAPEAVTAWRILAIRARGLGPLLEEIRAGMPVPARIDEGATLLAVEVSEHRLTLFHALGRGLVLDEEAAASIQAAGCADPVDLPLLQAGAEIIYSFAGPSMPMPFDVRVSAKECSI